MTDRRNVRDDEIDQLLGALRSDVPDMDPRAFAAGRARLLVAIGARPVAEAAPEPDGAVTLALPPDRRRRSPPLRRAAPWLAGAAAVAVVAAGAVAFLPDEAPPGGSEATTSPQPSPSASVTEPPGPGDPLPPMPAEPLNTAGDLAEHVQTIEPRPGQVHYVRMARTQAGGDGGPGGTEVEELWIPHDLVEGEWLVRRSADGEIQGRSDKDFVEDRAKGGRFESGWVFQEDPANGPSLPRDPEGWYERLQAEAAEYTGDGQTAAQQAIDTVISLLSDSTGAVPSDVRAALLRTLGYLPGVVVDPDAKASDGRPAVSLGYELDNGTYRNELLLDPATARVVDWRNVAIKAFNGWEPDQVFTSAPQTEAIVSELGQRP
jgi:hypothetical protein